MNWPRLQSRLSFETVDANLQNHLFEGLGSWGSLLLKRDNTLGFWMPNATYSGYAFNGKHYEAGIEQKTFLHASLDDFSDRVHDAERWPSFAGFSDGGLETASEWNQGSRLFLESDTLLAKQGRLIHSAQGNPALGSPLVVSARLSTFPLSQSPAYGVDSESSVRFGFYLDASNQVWCGLAKTTNFDAEIIWGVVEAGTETIVGSLPLPAIYLSGRMIDLALLLDDSGNYEIYARPIGLGPLETWIPFQTATWDLLAPASTIASFPWLNLSPYVQADWPVLPDARTWRIAEIRSEGEALIGKARASWWLETQDPLREAEDGSTDADFPDFLLAVWEEGSSEQSHLSLFDVVNPEEPVLWRRWRSWIPVLQPAVDQWMGWPLLEGGGGDILAKVDAGPNEYALPLSEKGSLLLFLSFELDRFWGVSSYGTKLPKFRDNQTSIERTLSTLGARFWQRPLLPSSLQGIEESGFTTEGFEADTTPLLLLALSYQRLATERQIAFTAISFSSEFWGEQTTRAVSPLFTFAWSAFDFRLSPIKRCFSLPTSGTWQSGGLRPWLSLILFLEGGTCWLSQVGFQPTNLRLLSRFGQIAGIFGYAASTRLLPETGAFLETALLRPSCSGFSSKVGATGFSLNEGWLEPQRLTELSLLGTLERTTSWVAKPIPSALKNGLLLEEALCPNILLAPNGDSLQWAASLQTAASVFTEETRLTGKGPMPMTFVFEAETSFFTPYSGVSIDPPHVGQSFLFGLLARGLSSLAWGYLLFKEQQIFLGLSVDRLLTSGLIENQTQEILIQGLSSDTQLALRCSQKKPSLTLSHGLGIQIAELEAEPFEIEDLFWPTLRFQLNQTPGVQVEWRGETKARAYTSNPLEREKDFIPSDRVFALPNEEMEGWIEAEDVWILRQSFWKGHPLRSKSKR